MLQNRTSFVYRVNQGANLVKLRIFPIFLLLNPGDKAHLI